MSSKKQTISKKWLAFTFAILALVLTGWTIGVIDSTGSIASAAMPSQISTHPHSIDTEQAADQVVPERPHGILDQFNEQFIDSRGRNVGNAKRDSEPPSEGHPNPPCGLEWRVVPSPNTGTQGNLVYDIDAISPNDIWATGVYYNDLSYHYRTLAMHWNGVGWTSVSMPNPGTGNNEIVSIAAVSSTEVWAVGGYYNTANPYR
jgi:hypothetical protein